jgi:hypothetical protein
MKPPFDWRAARGEWRLGLILAGILGLFRGLAALRGLKERRVAKKDRFPGLNH